MSNKHNINTESRAKNLGVDIEYVRNKTPDIKDSTLTILQSLSPVIGGAISSLITDASNEAVLDTLRGVSLDELRTKDPFNSILGDNESIQAAVQFKAQSSVSKVANEIYAKLDTLSVLSDTEQNKYIANKISSLNTGDPELDAATSFGVSKLLPTIMDVVSKNTAKARMETAYKDTVESIVQQGETLNILKSNTSTGVITEDIIDTNRANFIESLRPISGQSKESYLRGMRDSAVQLQRTGNFEATGIIKDIAYEYMSEIEKTEFDMSIKRATNDYMKYNNVPGTNKYEIIDDIQIGRFPTLEDLEEHLNNIDLNYRNNTFDDKGYFTTDEINKYKHIYNTIIQKKNEELQKAFAKQQERQILEINTEEAWLTGNKMVYQSAPSDIRNIVDKKVAEEWGSDISINNRVIINAANGTLNPYIKSSIDEYLSSIKAGTANEKTINTLQNTIHLLSGHALSTTAKLNYFGNSEYINQILNIDNSMNLDKFRRSMQILDRNQQISQLRQTVPSDIMKAIEENIEDKLKATVINSGIWGFFRSENKQYGKEIAIKNAASRVYKDVLSMMPNATVEDIAEEVYRRAENSLDTLGNFYIDSDISTKTLADINKRLATPRYTFDDLDFTNILEKSINDSLDVREPKANIYIQGLYRFEDDPERLYITASIKDVVHDFTVPLDTIARNIGKPQEVLTNDIPLDPMRAGGYN